MWKILTFTCWKWSASSLTRWTCRRRTRSAWPSQSSRQSAQKPPAWQVKRCSPSQWPVRCPRCNPPSWCTPTWPRSGPVTDSILFRWLFTIKDRCRKVRFQQRHIQGLHQMFLMVSWDLRALLRIPDMSLHLYSSGSNAKASWGPLMGTVSAQKALQGPETEMSELR